MKRRYFIAAMLLFAGAVLTTGCKKDEAQRFRLTIADQGGRSKTTLVATEATYHTLWQNDDAIYINGMNNLLNVQGVGSGNGVYAVSDVDISAVDGKYYAFYGGRGTNISSDFSANPSYSFTMPSSYTYSATDLHSPLAGVGSGSGDVTIVFQNLFALLELKVPAITCTITISEQDVTSNPTPLAGSFVTTCSGSTWGLVSSGTPTQDDYTLAITKNTDETVVYIPIPAGSHKLNIVINSTFQAVQKQSYGYLAGNYYKISTLPEGVPDAPPETPENADVLPYPFSDGYFFGKGNIRFNTTETNGGYTWALESEQWVVSGYNVQGKKNNITGISNYLAWMDGLDVLPAALNNSCNGTLEAEGYAYVLFGEGSDQLDHWRVPSRSEWNDILGIGTTTTDDDTWAYVKIESQSGDPVAGVSANGMLIAPIGTDLPSNVSLHTTYSSSNWSNVPSISVSQFYELEKKGCIFLPACGYRDHNGTAVGSTDGYYRTSDDRNSSAYYLMFSPGSAPTTSGSTAKGDGICVRLIYKP